MIKIPGIEPSPCRMEVTKTTICPIAVPKIISLFRLYIDDHNGASVRRGSMIIRQFKAYAVFALSLGFTNL